MALGNGVNWVRLSEPEYPPLARQGRIQGTVRIAIRFLRVQPGSREHSSDQRPPDVVGGGAAKRAAIDD